MPVRSRPAAEIGIDAALVRRLLVDQFPRAAGEPLQQLAGGWDNAVFRLGDRWVVRLPRRASAVPLVDNEQRWLARLAPGLPLPVPHPIVHGRPAAGFPWPWSVLPWFDGEIAALRPPDDLESAAVQLGHFLEALHRPAPRDAPLNPFRGGPLVERGPLFQRRLAELEPGIDLARLELVWQDAVSAERWPGPPLWLHGDLHPANLVVNRGRLAAVIDFGDLTGGDPATDLAVAWMLLPAPLRPLLRRAAGAIDVATWRRARGWALHLGVAMLSRSADDPVLASVGRRTLDAVADDDEI